MFGDLGWRAEGEREWQEGRTVQASNPHCFAFSFAISRVDFSCAKGSPGHVAETGGRALPYNPELTILHRTIPSSSRSLSLGGKSPPSPLLLLPRSVRDDAVLHR